MTWTSSIVAQLGDRRVEDRCERTDARGAHEEVELGQPVDPRADLGLVGDVEVREADLAERGRLDRRIAVRSAVAQPPATREHRGAFVGECARARGADAARAAGDERVLAE